MNHGWANSYYENQLQTYCTSTLCHSINSTCVLCLRTVIDAVGLIKLYVIVYMCKYLKWGVLNWLWFLWSTRKKILNKCEIELKDMISWRLSFLLNLTIWWWLWGESTGDRWIPLTKGQRCGKCFHDVIMVQLLEFGRASGVWSLCGISSPCFSLSIITSGFRPLAGIWFSETRRGRDVTCDDMKYDVVNVNRQIIKSTPSRDARRFVS